MRSLDVEKVLWKCPYCGSRRLLVPSHVPKQKTCGNRICRRKHWNTKSGLQVTPAGWEHNAVPRRADS